jgi:hypothetical protein
MPATGASASSPIYACSRSRRRHEHDTGASARPKRRSWTPRSRPIPEVLSSMAPEERLRQKRAEILRLCARYGARNVRVLGSVARGEASDESDVDLLVDFEPGNPAQSGRPGRRAGGAAGAEGSRGLRGRPLLAPAPPHPQGGPPAVTKDPRVYLAHILECIQKIVRFTADGSGSSPTRWCRTPSSATSRSSARRPNGSTTPTAQRARRCGGARWPACDRAGHPHFRGGATEEREAMRD